METHAPTQNLASQAGTCFPGHSTVSVSVITCPKRLDDAGHAAWLREIRKA